MKRVGRIHVRGLVALVLLAGCAVAVVLALVSQPAAGGTTPHRAEHASDGSRNAKHERYLYISTIAQSATDPDFIAVVGADPRKADFGQIVNRVDMPNVGDELHHFGYSADQRRLLVPGLFSNRIHILGINAGGRTLSVDAVNERLAQDSGYAVPHGDHRRCPAARRSSP